VAPLTEKILLFVGLLWAGASGLEPVVAQSTTPPSPKSVYDLVLEIGLDVVKNGCGGTVTSRDGTAVPCEWDQT
jgi:hypothetical protein